MEPAYAEMHSATPQLGRFFTETENKRRDRVAVIGMTVVRNLFGSLNPVGQTIKVNRMKFTVVGVLPEKGSMGPRDQDDMILVPLSTAMYRLFGKRYVDVIEAEVAREEFTSVAQDAISSLLAKVNRTGSDEDESFHIICMSEIQSAISATSRVLSLLLASIAAISLLVGGIGIMNIMLVSVTERTREIGLRKAVGATARDIMSQFLVEAIMISTAGGLCGIVLGWLLSWLAGNLAGWSTIVSPASVIIAVAFSGFVGIVFGIVPARKAARLNPIDALRYE